MNTNPGNHATQAASGIGDFEHLLDGAAARALTGNITYVDAGYHVMG